jgi:hypothetical protein
MGSDKAESFGATSTGENSAWRIVRPGAQLLDQNRLPEVCPIPRNRSSPNDPECTVEKMEDAESTAE